MTFAATESGPQRAQRRLLGLRGLLADFAGERDRALADLRATLELPALQDDEDADARTDLHVHLAPARGH
ncbi:MAG: hypothetical protein JNL82_35980 [Myxococcales bacterium]|nr:hypothetical protein [Myxococcales bacterium]